MDQAAVGGDGAALFHQQNIAGHQLARGDILWMSLAQHERGGCAHLFERLHSRLGACFLVEADQGVDQDDGHDGECFIGQAVSALQQPGPDRNQRCAQQQQDERIGELRQQTAPV